MTTRYQKRHYEDVARLLYGAVQDASNKDRWVDMELVHEFADLFAADNPPVCRVCDDDEGTGSICTCSCGGHHHFEGGFNRKQFLEACGLESEG